ncbi:hypothetical protein BC936DRAFT_139536 [Jimgerdemannia flammicorona]|uniref:Uncharacterized protein n=1 Tax=Jimgerdemannia flammicorona TaxID=994334 RepID=A0A433B9Q4_9FUNG|nr:hypothetical protein BC936DRAFT_139536 [Jimgerdemannia flammicorona]
MQCSLETITLIHYQELPIKHLNEPIQRYIFLVVVGEKWLDGNAQCLVKEIVDDVFEACAGNRTRKVRKRLA